MTTVATLIMRVGAVLAQMMIGQVTSVRQSINPHPARMKELVRVERTMSLGMLTRITLTTNC